MKTIFLSLILAATALAQNQPQALTVTIAASASVSSAVRVGGCSIANLEMDSAWTSAAVSFQGSSDGVTYKNAFIVADNSGFCLHLFGKTILDGVSATYVGGKFANNPANILSKKNCFFNGVAV